MVDECGNLLRGPPGIYGPYQKYCFNSAFAVDGNDTFTPCARSAQGLHSRHPAQGGQFRAAGGGVPGGLPVDFTPVMSAVSPQSANPYKSGCASNASGAMQCKGPLVTTYHNGKARTTCAVPVAQNISKNCVATMRNIWQCDRFLARGDIDGYNRCKAMQECFQYDVKMPDGTVLPMVVTATDTCLAAADVALRKAAPTCVNGLRKSCTPQPAWGKPTDKW